MLKPVSWDPVESDAGEQAANAAPFRIRALTVTYGETPVVYNLDFSPPRGAMVAIIGPNGAGKSSLLKAALGLIPRLTGEVHVFGEPVERARARVAYVPQRSSVDWEFPARARDVVMMGLQAELGIFRWPGREHRARARAALAAVGMEAYEHRQIGKLSGGQRQRVFLARALVQNADVLLLDEPFAGVDAATERTIISVLRKLRDSGRTIICVHHDLATVEAYFDYALLMNISKVAEGPVADVFTDANLRATYEGQPIPASLAARAGAAGADAGVSRLGGVFNVRPA